MKFDYDTNYFFYHAFSFDCLPLEEQKALLEKRMIVLHEYLSGIQKQDTEEWEEQVSYIMLPIFNV